MNVKEPIALVWKKLLQMHIGECFCALCYISDFCIAVAKHATETTLKKERERIILAYGDFKPLWQSSLEQEPVVECFNPRWISDSSYSIAWTRKQKRPDLYVWWV